MKFTQVISDVDDTIKSSGGVAVAGVALGGIDKQYARGEVYPGVAEFMLHVSLASLSSPSSSSSETSTVLPNPPKVAILTARAEEFKAALELKENSAIAEAFRNAGRDAGISDWGLGPVLYGSVVEWIVQTRKGLRKFNNFERLIQQDPTGALLQYVYVGDTGELDQEAAETMLREYPERVKAVFLHVVSSGDRAPTSILNNDGENNQEDRGWNVVSVPPPKLINGRPVIFFRTYVGAAVAAREWGLLTDEGLECVMEAATRKLKENKVPRTSDKWRDLNIDLDRAGQLLLGEY